MRIKADIELDAGDKSFATGLLPELISALRQLRVMPRVTQREETRLAPVS